MNKIKLVHDKRIAGFNYKLLNNILLNNLFFKESTVNDLNNYKCKMSYRVGN